MNKFEIEYVDTKKVSCSGSTNLGHPRIFLTINENEVTCPYCSKTFIYKSE